MENHVKNNESHAREVHVSEEGSKKRREVVVEVLCLVNEERQIEMQGEKRGRNSMKEKREERTKREGGKSDTDSEERKERSTLFIITQIISSLKEKRSHNFSS